MRNSGARCDGRSFAAQRTAEFRPRKRRDPACIVYSSGTGGRPKGCVLTHENYLEQCAAVAPLWPFWPGARYLSIIPTNHAIDFMGGFIMPFTGGGTVVHLRTLAAGVHSRSVHPIQDHLHGGRAAHPEESGARLARAVCGFAAGEAAHAERAGGRESRGHARAAAAVAEPDAAQGYSRGVWGRVARAAGGRSVHGAEDAANFSTSWASRSRTDTVARRRARRSP